MRTHHDTGPIKMGFVGRPNAAKRAGLLARPVYITFVAHLKCHVQVFMVVDLAERADTRLCWIQHVSLHTRSYNLHVQSRQQIYIRQPLGRHKNLSQVVWHT
jgi:hypothetical protein